MSVYGQFDASEGSAPLALVTLSSFPGSPHYYADVLDGAVDLEGSYECPHSPSFHPVDRRCAVCGDCCDECDAQPPTPVVRWDDEPSYSPQSPAASEEEPTDQRWTAISARRISALVY